MTTLDRWRLRRRLFGRAVIGLFSVGTVIVLAAMATDGRVLPVFDRLPRVFSRWEMNACPLLGGTAMLTLACITAERLYARRVRGLEGNGLCAECGYDLRQSPDACPECGTTVRRPNVRASLARFGVPPGDGPPPPPGV